MAYIPFANPEKSDLTAQLINKLNTFTDQIELSLDQMRSQGYSGKYSIRIPPHGDHFHASKFTNKDISRFPARIKAAATALKTLGYFGQYFITYSKGNLSISRVSGKKYFKLEVSNPETKYFIFDTGKKPHRDLDYEYYTWNMHRYNKVSAGDLFIYRKPQKVSSSNQFFFFGAGKVKEIIEAKPSDKKFVQPGDQIAIIDSAYPFENLIYQSDLEPGEITDNRQEKDSTWSHFFNNYGMNEISRDDFNFLLSKGLSDNEPDQEDRSAMIQTHNKILAKDYSVDDKEAVGKHRGAAQKIFSDTIKDIYLNKCAITGINTRSLLIGAHIIPWSKNKERRLDPQNGICLSRLMDKCFEDNLISIDEKYKVRIAKRVSDDPKLFEQLKPFIGKKITLPRDKQQYPDKICLEYKEKEFIENDK